MLIDIPIKEVSRPRETRRAGEVMQGVGRKRRGGGVERGGRPETHFGERTPQKYHTMCLRGIPAG